MFFHLFCVWLQDTGRRGKFESCGNRQMLIVSSFSCPHVTDSEKKSCYRFSWVFCLNLVVINFDICSWRFRGNLDNRTVIIPTPPTPPHQLRRASHVCKSREGHHPPHPISCVGRHMCARVRKVIIHPTPSVA